MKKFIIITIITGISLLSVSVVNAQSTNNAEFLNHQIISLLQQLILVLTQQVQELTRQLISFKSPISPPINYQIASSVIASMELEAIPPSIPADGKSTAKVIAKVKDIKGNLMPNQPIYFSYSGKTIASLTNSSGEAEIIYAATIQPITAEIIVYNQEIKNRILIQQTYFVAEFSSDKDEVKNDGWDVAIVIIKTKWSDGRIMPNKLVDINGLPDVSNNAGIIIYKTQMPVVITVTADGQSYSKTINQVPLLTPIPTPIPTPTPPYQCPLRGPWGGKAVE